MATLANEIIDLVIDQLGDDPPSLKSCSLVSRQWIPRSRFHNFRSAKLVIDLRYLLRFTSTPGAVAIRQNAFMDLLSSPLATFIGSLQELTLHHAFYPWIEEYTLDILRPMDILRRLEARGVRLRKLDLFCDSAGLFTRIHENPPFASSLVALDINLMAHDEDTKLSFAFEFICSYSKLEHLGVVDGYNWIETGTIKALRLPANLHSLAIGYLPALKWVVGLNPPTHITTLGFLNVGNQDLLTWEELIPFFSNPICHNIHMLVFTNIVVPFAEIVCCLESADFYNLRHLQVMQEYHSIPETLDNLLCEFPARKTIETVTVEVIIRDDMDTDDPTHAGYGWDWLARSLDNTLFVPEDWPVLRWIKFRGAAYHRVGQTPKADKFSRALHQNLPECVRRGLLEVNLWDEVTVSE
ncbi:hypothetical protein C8F01DRAFT_479708 [Mycena amicta]|nr:hypothetical protein C8F01DRAFT_479708 [Mycena amicta]